MKQPLVSVIVTTRNNESTLEACLRSIATQSYNPIELIVVDNFSTDQTIAIARGYTTRVFQRGPERTAQRNFAVGQAKGSYVLIVDSDMELNKSVVSACVQTVQTTPHTQAVIIPEESFGEGFWAQCKRLERSFYVGVDAIEAARFFARSLYKQLGGYSEAFFAGEDWDLSRRAAKLTNITRVDEYIRHNEGHPHFSSTVHKKYFYAKQARAFFSANPNSSALTDQSGPLARYRLFFSNPAKLFKNPILGASMLLLKTCEFGGGALGYLTSREKAGAANE
ncbi:MAG TPA: glycosyltransferase family A protein [Candidatus Saccharimonadales bacterium]|nr:glycosyltransferase family A protein [Candidatus Saccharimonadales bacterium]